MSNTYGSIYSSSPSPNPAAQKIFGIGLSKTGTSSLCKALQALGYSVIDFDNGLKHIHLFDAATDSPVAHDFEKLDREYPGSRFIYTVRERKTWLKSIGRHWEALRAVPQTPEDSEFYHRLYGLPHFGFDPAVFTEAYERHDQRVKDYFKGRDDLLIMDICGSDGWETLCPFLRHSIPVEPFPKVNVKIGPKRVNRLKRWRRSVRKRVRLLFYGD